MKKIIINTSTYKSSKDETTPDFINSMIKSLNKKYDQIEIVVLRPMKDIYEEVYFENNYKVVPYRYLWSIKGQTLWKYGLKPAYDINKLNIIKILCLFIAQFFSLKKLIKLEKPDFIYSQWFIPQAFITATIKNKSNIKKFFSTYGGDILIVKNMGYLGKKVINYVIKNTDKFSAISSLNLSQINNSLNIKFKKENKGKVIPLPIDDFFFEYKNSYSQTTKENKFLSIGRLIEVKGIDLLIDSLNILNQKGFTNFNLQILGDGIDKESLEEKVKKLNLRDKIKFEGWKNNNEKLKSYNENDVIFITSKQTKTIMEGGPLTLIEAMSQKKICICSDSVGYSEHIIDGENGILFNSGDAESLYQSIKKYLNLNDYERSKMKQKAFETSLRFKRENITEELYNYFFSH